MHNASASNTRTILILLLFAFLASLVIGYATRWGPWAYSDSVGYIANARNLIAGDGLGLHRASGRFVVTSHQPPLYILLLAFIGFLGIDMVAAARIIGIVSFAALVFIAGFIPYRLTRNSFLAIALSGITLSSPYLIDLYAGAMSEGLFILLTTTAVLLFCYGIGRNRDSFHYFAALVLGLASVTRYAGLGFLIALPMLLLLWRGFPRIRRVRVSVVSLFIALLPSILWNIWLGTQPTAEPVRSYSLDLGVLTTQWRMVRAASIDALWQSLPFFSKYFLGSYRIRFFILGGMAIGFILFMIWQYRRSQLIKSETGNGYSLIIAPLFFVSTYVLSLLAAFFFSSPQPDFNLRILSPAIYLIYISMISGLSWSSSGLGRNRITQLLCGVLVFLIIVGNAVESRWIIQTLHEYGRGYTSKKWKESITLEKLGEMDYGVPIITNDSIAILLYHNQAAYDLLPSIPEETEVELVRLGDRDGGEVDQVFRDEGALLVIFDTFQSQLEERFGGDWLPIYSALLEDLDVEYMGPDGAIYLYPK